MNRIITVAREFGSGGRELGRRIAQELNIAYYDHEIVLELSRRTRMTEQYIRQIDEQADMSLLPITTANTLSMQFYPAQDIGLTVFKEQSRIICEMAEKSGCVIVGRCGDYILRDQKPFRIFVYADMESKMTRCREKASQEEKMTDKELKQHILGIDKKRAKYYEFYTGHKWGDKLNFDMCINTSHMVIKEMVPALAKLFEN